jgi:hypothetical protein
MDAKDLSGVVKLIIGLMMKNEISPEEYEKALFEKLLYDFPSSHFQVIPNDRNIVGRYSGIKRQLDVAVYRKNAPAPFLVAEAKRHARKVGIRQVECFIGMLDDVGAKMGLLACPKGFSAPAQCRAAASIIRVRVVSVKEALEMNWRSVARDILPWDWAFHPHLAVALYRLNKKEDPDDIIEAIETIPFEEWLGFVEYSLRNHTSEAADFLWFIAQNHYDSGWRFNAIQQLMNHGLLNQSGINRILHQENDPDILDLLRRKGHV